MSKKVLIIGGVAGGASTAARLRRMDEHCEIILFERGQYISFANCGLPYHIGKSIVERDELLLQTPESMKTRFNIDVRIKNEVISINKEDKNISVKNLLTDETYTESYDVLVLSPGSSPIRPRISGIDSPNVFSLWNMPDMDAIIAYIKEKEPKNAVVVGGGFIGMEMAENLYDLGLKVSLVEMADQVMAPIDYDMAQLVHEHVSEKGIELYLKNGVSSFEYNEGKTTIHLQSGVQIDTDLVIFSIGIRPNSELAKAAGLTVNERGGIVVSDTLLTSDENIYALGDAIEVEDFVNKTRTMIPLAGPANKQGRIVANNISGIKESYNGTMGSSIAKVFDLAVAATGNNEKTLNRLGKVYKKDYHVTIVYPNSHAGYYPGASPMTIKLIFDGKGRILGAQIVGMEGVDKRIDVIATVMKLKGTIYDLKELELAYAPPYSSAKDPVNMAGFTAENILKGEMPATMWHEVEAIETHTTTLLDVRTKGEFKRGTIRNSLLMPVDDLRIRMNELDKNKEIIIFCGVGIRGYIAGKMLMQNGFKVSNLLGGFQFYNSVTNIYGA